MSKGITIIDAIGGMCSNIRKQSARMLVLYVLAFAGSCTALTAQDIHWSQFYHAPLNTNPALTGVFDGDLRFAGIYRAQWFTVPVSYQTVGASYDMRVLEFNKTNSILAAGLQFNYDVAGDSKLSLTELQASVAYTQGLSEKHFLTVGFQVGGAQRAMKTEALTFDAQFNGDIFVEGSNTNESFPSTSFFFLDLGAGLNYHFQHSKRTKFNVGGAVSHIQEPQQSFFENVEVRLARKYTGTFDASFQLTDKLDILPAFLFQRQGTYKEIVGGMNIKWHLDQRLARETGVLAGVWYRHQDAIAPFIGIHFRQWQLGFTYDVNISEFTAATNRNGGPEVSVIYTIKKVDPLDAYKACPLF